MMTRDFQDRQGLRNSSAIKFYAQNCPKMPKEYYYFTLVFYVYLTILSENMMTR